MGTVNTKMKGTTEISAVITRADGTVEDLGVIATNKPKNKSVFENIKKVFKK